nr:zFucci-G1 phase probe [synthetic construct]
MVSVIKPEMKMRYYMDGSVNGHEFTIEGEGTGRPYEGHQEMTLRVTMAEGGPMPFAFDLVSHVFCYGHRVFTKYPEEIPDYFKQAFPEGLSWERSLEFEDGGSASVSAHISLRGNTFYHKSKFTGVNFPADGPIMQNQSVDWEPSTEKITASDGVLKGDVTMYLKLEGGGNHKCQMKTTYKAAKEILEMPGDHYIGHRLVRKTEGNITEQVEDAVAHYSMLPSQGGYPSHWRPLEMAQARVTDYFAQSKKAGVSRSLRSKGQKVSGDVVESAVINKPRSSSRASGSSRKATHSEITTAEPQKQTQLEFLKVIDEALSTETADTVADSRDVKIEGLTASPRTPKRSSPEFDVCSVLFPSTAELHSSAKKRQRLNAGHNCRSSPEERAGQKTARKKLYLLASDDKVKTTEPLASSSPQAPQQTARKE